MANFILAPIRICSFIIGFTSWWMESFADWLIGARAHTEYVLAGKCKRCGRCCRCLALKMPKWISNRAWFVKIVQKWHFITMNFRFITQDGDWLIYRCGYYKESNGTCDVSGLRRSPQTPARAFASSPHHYRLLKAANSHDAIHTTGSIPYPVASNPGYCSIYMFRHRLCRFFPRQNLYGHPDLNPDCGFSFLLRPK